MQAYRLLIATTITALSAAANSATVDGLPIALGDTVERVQSALATEAKPEPSASTTPGATAIRLRTRGIWVFFDKEGRAYTIRLDAPFPGSLKGVTIGSTYANAIEKLGKPAKTLKTGFAALGQPDPIIYYFTDSEGVRLNFDRDGMLETIYVNK